MATTSTSRMVVIAAELDDLGAYTMGNAVHQLARERDGLVNALRHVRDDIAEGAQFDKRWEDVLTALDAAIASQQ